jgi:hypothetical protein
MLFSVLKMSASPMKEGLDGLQDYWVIQNDCGQVWQLCTKIYVATVWMR